MALDPSIALGVRPIELPNQLAQYGQMQQILAAQDAQQMNALKMQEARATMDERNMLRRLDPTAPDYEAQLFRVNPQLGINYRKEASAAAASKAQQLSHEATAAETKQKYLSQALRDISGRPDNENIISYARDIQASPLFSKEEKANALALQEKLFAIPFDERGAYLASQGAKPGDLKPTTQVVNRSGSSDIVQIAPFSNKPTTVGTFPDTPYPTDVEEQKLRLALAGRAPGQPRAEPAPTVTSIQDPTNPNQMISINARDYRGGGVGSPGVIGLTGKTPAATAKQDAIDKGHAQLASVVDDLRSSYDTLEKAAAIPSTKRGTISNLMSSAQASGIGQVLGRMGGTEEQSARDTINSSRMMLLNSIKQATGMSAQQLNSNVELTSWLKAVSDPTQSTETVNKILGNIEKFVESGGKYSAKKDSAAAAPAANIDALLNKYK
tara:strand:+ start:1906 stop:3225 length:1320 start_codon:yes stop_codon:yes gene_type:complete